MLTNCISMLAVPILPQAAKRETATLAISGIAYEAHTYYVALYGVKKCTVNFARGCEVIVCI